MRYAADAIMAREIDDLTTKKHHIPSIVLMERASLCTADIIMENEAVTKPVVVFAGGGNNGGDGIATGRILHENGYDVAIVCFSSKDRMSEQTALQYDIASSLGMEFIRFDDFYDKSFYQKNCIIIDAIFGVGLNREIRGEYADCINKINHMCRSFNSNELKNTVYSIDIPSGLNASTGRIMGTAVKADYTVTYGLMKTGLLLQDAAEFAGKVHVCDIGFPKEIIDYIKPDWYYFEENDLNLLPARKSQSNKGTYGKVVICAGSPGMCGAAYLSAYAAYRCGCGLVKVLTCDENVDIIKTMLPEALVSSYSGDIQDMESRIKDDILWADATVVGPGIGISSEAEILTLAALKYSRGSVVIDADGINLLSGLGCEMNEEKSASFKVSDLLAEAFKENSHKVIMTPHLKEMTRYSGGSIEDIKNDIIGYALKHCYNNTVLVLKDARTVVTDGKKVYINISGNNGMATGGSGDVLTGLIASFLAQGADRISAAALGVYVHGLAGDAAAKKLGCYSLIARDIADNISEVLKVKPQ